MLAFLYSTLIENKPEGVTLYADIDGGTIPPKIMITTSRSDIVINKTNTNPTSVILTSDIYLCHTFGIRKFKQVIRNSKKVALLGSYAIYLARSAPDWSGSGVLKP